MLIVLGVAAVVVAVVLLWLSRPPQVAAIIPDATYAASALRRAERRRAVRTLRAGPPAAAPAASPLAEELETVPETPSVPEVVPVAWTDEAAISDVVGSVEVPESPAALEELEAREAQEAQDAREAFEAREAPETTAAETYEPYEPIEPVEAHEPVEELSPYAAAARRDDEAWERIFGMLRPSEDELARARAVHGIPHRSAQGSGQPALLEPSSRLLSVVPEQRSVDGTAGADASTVGCGACSEPGHEPGACPSAQAS